MKQRIYKIIAGIMLGISPALVLFGVVLIKTGELSRGVALAGLVVWLLVLFLIGKKIK